MASYKCTTVIFNGKVSESKTPRWLRAGQIGLGAVAIVLSVLVMAHPIATTISLVILLSAILIVVGIEKVISGIVVRGKIRWGSIGLGIIVIILSLIVLANPIAATLFVIALLSAALFIQGIAQIVSGVANKRGPMWSRMFSIAAGVIAIALSGFIIASPIHGAIFVSFVLGIALLIIGIYDIVAGVSGRKIQMMPARDHDQ